MHKHPVIDDRRRKMRLNFLIGIAFGCGIALLIAAVILLILALSKPEETSGIPVISTTPMIPSPTTTPFPATSVMPSESIDDYLVNCIKANAEKNADVIGWIRIEGTLIDYPVVQTDDISYYLTHDAARRINVNGAIFLDRNCDPISLSGNNILYGHHMKDGSMFAALVEYDDEDFLRDHPIIEFATTEKTYQWEIFAVFITACADGFCPTIADRKCPSSADNIVHSIA